MTRFIALVAFTLASGTLASGAALAADEPGRIGPDPSQRDPGITVERPGVAIDQRGPGAIVIEGRSAAPSKPTCPVAGDSAASTEAKDAAATCPKQE
jgi:hypothetical protein